jgi:hypothetical protein
MLIFVKNKTKQNGLKSFYFCCFAVVLFNTNHPVKDDVEHATRSWRAIQKNFLEE